MNTNNVNSNTRISLSLYYLEWNDTHATQS